MNSRTELMRIIDVLMTAALFCLMGFQYTGEMVHEILGAIMLVLFLTHNLLNLKWYRSLGSGRYNRFRIVQTAVNLLLLMDMFGMIVSGIVMSRYVFRFLPISRGQYMSRMIHLAGSHWGFLLMSIHLGLHWGMVLSMGKKVMGGKVSSVRRWGMRSAAFLIACLGVNAFWKQGFHMYLFLTNEFLIWDSERTVIHFLAQEISIMGTCIFITYYGMKLPQRKNRKGVF